MSPYLTTNTANRLHKGSLNLRAVVDIGSNTIRLLIAQPRHDFSSHASPSPTSSNHAKNHPIQASPSHAFEQVHYEHHIARLGEGLQQTGQLGTAGKARAMDVFKRIIAACQDHGIAAHNIKAVATAAIREASNGKAFIEDVQSQTALTIQVISGHDEAELALKGATLGLPENISQNMLLFDIGGGSTEFTRIMHGKVIDSMSLKLGVVRLTESNLPSDPPSASHYQALQQQASTFISTLENFWTKTSTTTTLPLHLVGTAGTATTLAAIAQNMTEYHAPAINGYALSRASFDALRQRLCQQTNAQRLTIPLLEQGREDVIIAGLAIIEVLFQRWHYDAFIAVDSGLLEGLLYTE